MLLFYFFTWFQLLRRVWVPSTISCDNCMLLWMCMCVFARVCMFIADKCVEHWVTFHGPFAVVGRSSSTVRSVEWEEVLTGRRWALIGVWKGPWFTFFFLFFSFFFRFKPDLWIMFFMFWSLCIPLCLFAVPQTCNQESLLIKGPPVITELVGG